MADGKKTVAYVVLVVLLIGVPPFLSSFEVFLMVTLGGPGTLIGPALGAGAIVLLKNVISTYTHRWLLILGTVYIVTILGAPQGLWNLMGTSSPPQRTRRTRR